MVEGDETRERIRLTAERYHAEFPWADADAIEVYLSLVHAQRTIAAGLERYLSSLPLPKTTTSARHTVLRTLYFAHDRLSQNQIGRELGVSRTNITNLMDGLEEEGLIRRVVNPDDRRSNYVELTLEGERLCNVLIPAVTKFMVDGLRGFSPEQRAQLSEYLARFRTEIEAEHLQ